MAWKYNLLCFNCLAHHKSFVEGIQASHHRSLYVYMWSASSSAGTSSEQMIHCEQKKNNEQKTEATTSTGKFITPTTYCKASETIPTCLLETVVVLITSGGIRKYVLLMRVYSAHFYLSYPGNAPKMSSRCATHNTNTSWPKPSFISGDGKLTAINSGKLVIKDNTNDPSTLIGLQWNTLTDSFNKTVFTCQLPSSSNVMYYGNHHRFLTHLDGKHQ